LQFGALLCGISTVSVFVVLMKFHKCNFIV
jgi:hypothetical protein